LSLLVYAERLEMLVWRLELPVENSLRILRKKEETEMKLKNLKKLWIWEKPEEDFYASKCVGRTLHVCCGKSKLGDVRVDIKPQAEGVITMDYRKLEFPDMSFDTVICDPPWFKADRFAVIKGNPSLRWLLELKRVAKKRIIIIHHHFFTIRNFKLVEAWCLRTKGLLWKVCGIYDRIEYPLNCGKERNQK